MPAKKDPRDTVITAAMDLAAERRWHSVTLIDISQKSGVAMDRIYPLFQNKNDILRAFVQKVDQQVLAELDADDFDQPRHDRLMDVIMARFDALAPYRPALKSILKDCGDVGLADGTRAAKTGLASMRWMLEAAGFETGGLHGSLRVAGLGAIYARCFRQWLNDETPDYGPTMALLDKSLSQSGNWDVQLGKGLSRLADLRNKFTQRCRKTATDHSDTPARENT
ncbi:TetR family transcriptional regulator [Thalassospira profundimaris]|uniref:TetR family transcriptional regulator n=1 Tax=Thalassospira profundimaris TaxID=502049 RepID=UPI000DEE07D8|nr:TetR family transcriptional regulator [Thalassospira profundimaris]